MSPARPAVRTAADPPDPRPDTVPARTDAPGGPAELLRRAFRRHPGGVAVVTAAGPAGPVGLTVTSLVSVSLQPPLLSFNVARTASGRRVFAGAGYVGVHLLGRTQVTLADRFSRSGIDRFAPPTSWSAGPFGVPVLDGVAAGLVAVVRHRADAGDHDLVVAEVLHGQLSPDPGDPLVYHDGRFATVGPLEPDAAPVAVPALLRQARS